MQRKRWLLLGGLVLFIGLCLVCLVFGGAMAWLLSQAEVATQAPPATAPVADSDQGQPAPLTPNPTAVPPQPTEAPAQPASAGADAFLLLLSEQGVWKVAAQGLTQVAAVPVYESYEPFTLSPSGQYLALISKAAGGIDLVLVHLPSGQVQKVQSVATSQHMNNLMYVAALIELANLTWHPQGRLLAFVALTGDGSTSGLYVYDLETQQVTPVDEGSGFVALPSWSPDGRYLFYASLTWPAMQGGREPGPYETELTRLLVWDATTGERITLNPVGKAPLRPASFLGWMDAAHLLFSDRGDRCLGPVLSVNVPGGQAQGVSSFTFTSLVALDNTFFVTSTQDCSLGAGTFLWKPGSNPQPLVNGRTWAWIRLPSDKGVLTYGVSSGDAILTVDGRVIPAPDTKPERFYLADVSSQGYQAWYDAGAKEILILIPEAERQAYPELSESITLPARGSLDFLGWGIGDPANLYMVTEKGDVIVAMGPIFPDQTLGNIGRFITGLWVP